MSADLLPALRPARVPWNKGRIIGQKRPLLPRHVWSIRVRLEMAGNPRHIGRPWRAATAFTQAVICAF